MDIKTVHKTGNRLQIPTQQELRKILSNGLFSKWIKTEADWNKMTGIDEDRVAKPDLSLVMN